jgi:hypothetical protein
MPPAPQDKSGNVHIWKLYEPPSVSVAIKTSQGLPHIACLFAIWQTRCNRLHLKKTANQYFHADCIRNQQRLTLRQQFLYQRGE